MELIIILMIASLLKTITARKECNCMPMHPQQAYCNSDFVIRAKVLKDRWLGLGQDKIIDTKPRYDIQIITIWKGDEAIQKALDKKLTSTLHDPNVEHGKHLGTLYTSSTACTLNLKVGVRYALTGNIIDHRLYMNQCHWRILWDDQTKTIRKYLRKDNISCECEVQPCIGGSCNHVKKTCQWDLSLFPPPCSWRFCKKVDNTCTWSKEIKIDLCEER